jgi:integrase
MRDVRLSTSLVEFLRRHLVWLKSETLKRGWGQPEWLFPSSQNEPVKEAYGTKLFHRACREAGVPDTHVPYDCRHSYASLMFSGGANLGFISRQLGHKNSAITLKVYAKWLKKRRGRPPPSRPLGTRRWNQSLQARRKSRFSRRNRRLA